MAPRVSMSKKTHTPSVAKVTFNLLVQIDFIFSSCSIESSVNHAGSSRYLLGEGLFSGEIMSPP